MEPAKIKQPAVFLRVRNASEPKLEATGKTAVEGFTPKVVMARCYTTKDSNSQIRTREYVAVTEEELKDSLFTAYTDLLAMAEAAE